MFPRTCCTQPASLANIRNHAHVLTILTMRAPEDLVSNTNLFYLLLSLSCSSEKIRSYLPLSVSQTHSSTSFYCLFNFAIAGQTFVVHFAQQKWSKWDGLKPRAESKFYHKFSCPTNTTSRIIVCFPYQQARSNLSVDEVVEHHYPEETRSKSISWYQW